MDTENDKDALSSTERVCLEIGTFICGVVWIVCALVDLYRWYYNT